LAPVGFYLQADLPDARGSEAPLKIGEHFLAAVAGKLIQPGGIFYEHVEDAVVYSPGSGMQGHLFSDQHRPLVDECLFPEAGLQS